MQVRVIPWSSLGCSEVTLLGEREEAALCPSVYCVLVIYGVTVSVQYVVEFPCLPYFWSISLSPDAFLFSNFLSAESSSSCEYCPSLMSSWLQIIFVIGSSETFRGFPRKFSKFCFLLVDRFEFSSCSSFPSTHFVYRLPCNPRLSIFHQVSYLIGLILYAFCLVF